MPAEKAETGLPPCKCKRMTAILKRLGAVHAAKMHDLIAQGVKVKWTPDDWELHFREEERFVFPILLRMGLHREVQALADDHRVLRRQFRDLGQADPRMLKRHAEFEDELVLSIPMR